MGVLSNCGASVDLGCSHAGSSHGIPPSDISPLCNYYPEHGLDCIYCVPLEDRTDCTIESGAPCKPCGTGESFGRHFAPPGALIIPDDKAIHTQRSEFRGSPDLFSNESPFTAGKDNSGPLVRYYLLPFSGKVHPVFPDRNFAGTTRAACCTWLCHWTVSYDAFKAWELYCHHVRQVQYPQPPRPLDPVPFRVQFGRRLCYIHFNFANLSDSCFPLRDQYCFTAGRQGVEPGQDWWEHTTAAAELAVLDHLRVSYNMRLADDDSRFPWKEPPCKAIVNDALAGVETLGLNQLSRDASRSRHFLYNDPALNEWGGQVGFPNCATSPAVRRGGSGAPVRVQVHSHEHHCHFPGTLVYRRVTVLLRASVERGRLGFPRVTAQGIRVAATLDCLVELTVRLDDGWQAPSCALRTPSPSQCFADFADPTRNVILLADGCTTVPLSIEWHGMLGPRPWSKGDFNFRTPATNARCCDVLRALDGFLVPGEVNDFNHPDASQVYSGDVFVALNIPASQFGC